MDYVPSMSLTPNNINSYATVVLFDNVHAETDKCVILDIDETCVHSYNDKMPDWLRETQYYDILSNSYDIRPVDAVSDAGTGIIMPMWGVCRPHLKEFLLFAYKYFKHVLVWSAGARHYVNEVVRVIFSGIPSPTVIYTRDDIPVGPTTKPLSIILKDKSIIDSGCNLHNTYIVDDRYDYFINNVHNGIQIPAYDPVVEPNALRSDDQSLLVLKWWLSRPLVRQASDIRMLDKSVIFNSSAEYWEQMTIKENKVLSSNPSSLNRQNFLS